jgi:hypothetical protein
VGWKEKKKKETANTNRKTFQHKVERDWPWHTQINTFELLLEKVFHIS